MTIQIRVRNPIAIVCRSSENDIQKFREIAEKILDEEKAVCSNMTGLGFSADIFFSNESGGRSQVNSTEDYIYDVGETLSVKIEYTLGGMPC